MTETKDRPTLEEPPSEAEINERLNDLLARWHAYSSGYSLGKGYPSADAACRHSKSSSSWDGWNGVSDAQVEKKIMEAFDACVWTIPQPHLTAIQFQARNLHTGRQVWNSPRLPADEEERRILTMEARNMLMRALARGGVMS